MAAADGPSRIPWLVLVCAGIGLAVLLSLGTWQVKRLAWKEGLLATIHERMNAAPKPLAEVAAMEKAGEDIDYLAVTATGRFLHDSEQFFFATHKGASGWYVYTPLELSDGTGVVFVNRGFVPYDRKEAATRAGGQVAGELEITGLARAAPGEKPSSVVPDNDLAKNVYYWKDLSNMTAQSGFKMSAEVVQLFVDADDAPNPDGLPVGGVTMIDLPNNHLQYAVTWFGLALALLGVGGRFLYARIVNERKTARS